MQTIGRVWTKKLTSYRIATEMVKIRLKQTGKKHQRTYRIVVVDSRSKRDGGNVLAVLGHYNPLPDISEIKMDVEETEKWVSCGAVMTDRVRKIYDLIKSGKLIES